jgi:hypothetical protein
MVNDRLDHLLTYVANFELSPHLSSGPITLIWMSIGQAILFAIGHITRQFDRNTDHVHVMHCAPRSPPAAEVALACARVVAPSSLTARRHKCSSICYSHHRLPVDVQRGEHARGQRQCRTARRSRLATPITVNAAGGARLLQRPPAAPRGELGPSPLYMYSPSPVSPSTARASACPLTTWLSSESRDARPCARARRNHLRINWVGDYTPLCPAI